jgi:hypothetical protein
MIRYFEKPEGLYCLFHRIVRRNTFCRGNTEPLRRQRAIEGIEGHRRVEGWKAVESRGP